MAGRSGGIYLVVVAVAISALLAPSARAQTTPPAAAATVGAAAVPVEAFFNRPNIESVQLSPSGRWLAVGTAQGASRVSLAVFDMQTLRPHARVATFTDADVAEVHWVNDEMLVFTLQDNQSGGADQGIGPGLYAVARDGSKLRQLVKTVDSFVTDRFSAREPLSGRHSLLHVPSGDGNEVIVGEHVAGRIGQAWTVIPKRLDVITGRTSNLAYGSPADVRSWWFDDRGEPRLVSTRRDDGVAAYHWRNASTGQWRVLAEFDDYRAPWRPRFVDPDGNLHVSVASGADGTGQLHRFDFDSGRPVPQPQVSTPGFDIRGGLVTETAGGRALGVRTVTDAESTVWFEPRLQALQKLADERWPHHVNRINCSRCLHDDITAVVYSFSDRDPGQYWIYRGSDQGWRMLGSARPAIEPRLMASTDLERVRMRDGLEVPVWVTMPRGKADKPRPAVVLVHGGPWVRGRVWHWEAKAQFLASRGYVVIEPEFRGSTGYGQRLYRAGWRQWGQAMQDDLVDSLQWAVAKGWVDKDRVCIAGASYGGYATLMGLVRHPESYRCGVAWVAVTDPRLMFKWRYITDQSDDVRSYDYPTLIGHPDKDRAMLEAAAPVLHARRIQAPVMLAVGTEDRRVPVEHGNGMREALTEAGNPPLWVSYSDEGHGFFKSENRADFYRKMEAFLARHLQGAR